MGETVATRSPSETLMDCLAEFGESEPTKVLVIWTDEAGDINWNTSSPRSLTGMIGMLHCVEAAFMQDFLDIENKK